jgi:DNA-binding NtrC family response regulator
MPDVLLIEDDEQVRRMVTVALQAAGFTVAAAEDGREGLALFRKDPARVVVTDLFMPKMDGLEVIQVFRRLAPEVKLIAVSGGGSYRITGPLQAAERLGAHMTLEKPFELDELAAAVREALGD